MDPNNVLKMPYARMVTPDIDGSFFAEIVEFPGCFATGLSATEALENLESVAIDWIKAALSQGQDIPAPMEANDYSGKLVLRMTKGLHKRAALWAQREGVSLNQFIVTCVAEQVGERAAPRRQIVLNTAHSYQNLNLLVIDGAGSGGWITPNRSIDSTNSTQYVTPWGQYAGS